MTTRQVNLTRYNRSTSGIVDGQTVYAAHQINNYTPIETALDETQPYVEAHEKSIAGIERRSFIRQFDDDQVTTGTNSITINGGSWLVLCEVDNSGIATERTGWANSGNIDVTGITNGVVWAIYPGFTYQATNNLPASKPANACRLLTFTNNAGVVTVDRKSWQNSVDADNHIWEGAHAFNGSIIARGSVTGFLPANYHDIRAEWVSASQIKILAGSRCRSNDNTVDIVFSADHTIDMTNATPTSTTGGRTVAESANAWYYLYVGLDVNGLPLGWIDTANLAGGGSVTNPAAYSIGRRQVRFALRNNASSDILNFCYSANSKILYNVNIGNWTAIGTNNVLNAGTASTFTDLSLASLVPAISRLALLKMENSYTDSNFETNFRENGATHDGLSIRSTAGATHVQLLFEIGTDTSQIAEYKRGNGSVYVWVVGYQVTEVI